MPNRRLTNEQVLTLVAETQSRIVNLTKGLAPNQLLVSPEPGEYSARDELSHLRACADMRGKCITEILSDDRPTIKAVNPTTRIKQTDYREQEFQPSLQAFTAQRAELLAVLKPLVSNAWSREVTEAEKPRERTVHTYAQWLATHERPHIKQIERIVKTMPV